MASQTQQDDFCLECNWEAFHIDGKPTVDPSGTVLQHHWNCSSHETQTPLPHCEVDEACCDVDDCALDCGSLCDGFVGCDTSTVCSVTHCGGDNCDDDNCDDNHCDNNRCDTNHCEEDNCEVNHCESIDPLCLEDHCCDGSASSQDCGFDILFGLNTPLSLDTGMFPPPVMGNHSANHAAKVMEHPLPSGVDPYQQEIFLSSYQTHATHCEQDVSNHFQCHDFQKDWQGMFVAPPVPTQPEVNPAEVFHMLGMCSDFSVCQDQHIAGPQSRLDTFEDPKVDTSDAFNCFNPEHHHVHSHFKNPNDFNLQTVRKGPHRNHHRCRAHTHAHSHPYSRQSRLSISSHLHSSPGETPPPLEVDSSSVLTTPDFSPADTKLHICKWSTQVHGIKVACGATFADCGTLQEHLVASHMNTVNGAKGNGYYCCWEGCHRPDEPFSQKSKLQGHFLTHSNYKNFSCSVCGKAFARQATLDRHERSHRGDKPYTCKDCGKSFTDSSELKTHSRTHTGEKPFKCTWPGCSFTTGDSSNMSSHRLTHGERRHKCLFPGCTKSFTRPDQLKRHQKTTHKQESCSSLPSPSPEHFTMTPFPLVQRTTP